MQKKIIALAIAAAFAAPAVAMAEATFYGSMDGGLRHQTNDNTGAVVYDPATNKTTNPGGGGTTDTMQMGQYNTARWGFKVVEDMGDGMKTNVVLETSFGPYGVGGNPDLNTAAPKDFSATNTVNNPFGLIFDRQATLGLEGGWGKFDMGWNYTTSFKIISTYDPMNYKFLAVAGAKSSEIRRFTPASATFDATTGNMDGMKSVAQDRAGMVTYENKFGDVGIRLEYDVNNTTKNAQPGGGPGRALGVTYASGPVNVGFAYSAIEASAGQEDKVAHITAGAGYNFGDGKVSVGYAKNTITAPENAGGVAPQNETDTNIWGGVSYKAAAATEVTFAYYKNTFSGYGTNVNWLTGAAKTAPEATKNTMMLAVTYALSKKTNLYVEVDKTTSNSGKTGDLDVIMSGTSLGLNTSF